MPTCTYMWICMHVDNSCCALVYVVYILGVEINPPAWSFSSLKIYLLHRILRNSG